jgi:hypothetical protein
MARNIVQRYALETGSEQGFSIDEKVAHHCLAGGQCRIDIAGRPGQNLLWRTG